MSAADFAHAVVGEWCPIYGHAGCAGGCGLVTTNPELAGWEYLPISARWRCWDCTQALRAASTPVVGIVRHEGV